MSIATMTNRGNERLWGMGYQPAPHRPSGIHQHHLLHGVLKQDRRQILVSPATVPLISGRKS